MFGNIISQALNELNKLKSEMDELNFPVEIDRRPDRLFFDMKVSFKHAGRNLKEIEDTGDCAAIIHIGKRFKEILNEKRTFKLKNNQKKEYHLYDVMRIVVEGHTDETKSNEMANFHFSSDRALAVLQLLMTKCELKPPTYRISVAAYAEFGRQAKLKDCEKAKKNCLNEMKEEAKSVRLSEDASLHKQQKIERCKESYEECRHAKMKRITISIRPDYDKLLF